LFVHLDPSKPGRAPYLRPWSWDAVEAARDRVTSLVGRLRASMEQGVFLRLPHERGRDNRSGLCRGCPSPALCRAWREEESLRHMREERLRSLHAARKIDRLGGTS
ncbi:MAG: hypothetical protein R6W82_03385, partial [bacterium]